MMSVRKILDTTLFFIAVTRVCDALAGLAKKGPTRPKKSLGGPLTMFLVPVGTQGLGDFVRSTRHRFGRFRRILPFCLATSRAAA
jgi:hypothetical protein